jgi:hypothetical protein
VLLQKVEILPVLSLNFLENQTSIYELVIEKNYLQHNTFGRLREHFAGVLADFRSYTSGRLGFGMLCTRECNSQEQIFLGENLRYKAKCTNKWSTRILAARYQCAYLQYVIKCVSISEFRCRDVIEMFQAIPSRKLRHAGKAKVSMKIRMSG